MCRVSVIVPVYNTEDYLSRCVDSILAQTFTDFDLVLVDDGSPDGSGGICDEYARIDSRIHVIHQSNGGAAAARNAGIDWVLTNSGSQWIAFVDSDDYLHPTMIERLINAAELHNTKISVCGYVETNGEPIESCESSVCVLTPEVFYCKDDVIANVVPWGKLYHRDCFAEIRFPAGRLHEDEFVTYRILFGQSLLAFVDAPLYGYFMNDAGAMRSAWKPRRMEVFDALDEQVAFFYQNGYFDIARNRAMYYMWIVRMNIDLIRQTPDNAQYRRYIGICKNKLRQFIKTYQKPLQLNLIDHYLIFATARPQLSLWYRCLRKSKVLLSNVKPKSSRSAQYHSPGELGSENR